ncbi:symmetrical bis(5'-nucleosyl)-tetraphosphatase [Methylibium rhizosphaerae]|uniref:symmetrical bis(5'-nucleosyl)-tetraphosphatase n=1 Tax=Methylibium rhizosphaerae TaxID=2570323 RepID=UPI001129C164|nr:symmetrical bis(5'-nucleosyl)-tetraphosphatase [Methylibium rhizosphaerae]
MNYLIGDVQGCCDALDRLLAEIGFSPSRDRLYMLGDLVNRGPDSLGVLRTLRGFGDAAVCLLGNHDLHLLAVAAGLRQPHRKDTTRDILEAPDRDAWIAWLREHRLAVYEHGWLMVHAGVAPQWDLDLTLRLAGEVETLLRGGELEGFLRVMYGNEPSQWKDDLLGADRWRFAVNALTRIRFCRATDGALEFESKEGLDSAPLGYVPWFQAPGRRTAGVPIAFGHWSTLGLINQSELLAIDTGCVWGGRLTAVRVDGGEREVIQVRCEEAQSPL